jgi:hypothetical protein
VFTRRRVLLFGLPAATVAGLLVAWLLWPRTAITQENAARIEPGMTLAEAEALLGGPARCDATGPYNVNPADFAGDPWCPRQEEALTRKDGEVIGWQRSWATDNTLVVVRFDRGNRVTEVVYGPVTPVQRDLLRLIRRWLRL